MGVDLHSVLVNLNNQPEVGHQCRLTLLFIQGGAFTLRVTAAAIITFKHIDKQRKGNIIIIICIIVITSS